MALSVTPTDEMKTLTVGNKIYEIVDDQAREDVSEAKADLLQKANIDGAYSDLTAGNAEQLVSTVYEEDSVPYLFRTAGGSMDIGDREEDMLVGGTVAWNQMVNADNAVSGYTKFGIEMLRVSGKFAFTASGTYSYSSGDRNFYVYNLYEDRDYMISGHKYLVTNTSKWFCAYVYGAGAVMATVSGNIVNKSNQGGVIINCIGSGSYRLSLHAGTNIPNDTVINETIYVNVFDLTQMFGSTIADYIYSLELANAGAGVAWFRKLFPKDYYAFNAGSMLHVEGVSAHKTVGFNQWDEEWEVGTFNTTTGANNNVSNQIRSKNIIKILPNTTYYWNSPVYNWTILYDANGNVIPTPNVSGTGSDARSGNSFSIASKHTFTTPANAYGMRFYTGTYIGEYKNDLCINLHWDGERDGEYEPYVKHSYPLDSSLTLRGIPKLDSANNLYYDGDTYESDGTVTRRYGIVDLGTLNYSKSVSGLFATNIPTSKTGNGTEIGNILASGYTTIISNSITGPSGANPSPDKVCALGNGETVFYFNNLSYTDETAFKTAMSGVYLIYELATSTTETAEPYQNPQIVDDFGTEEYVTTGIVPVGHVTKYQPNLRAKLEMSPDSPDGDGDYIVRQANGENSYITLASTATIQDILARLTALEGNTNES